MSKLEFTGERFVPGTPGEIWIEHWHRYHFASRFAAGRRVLDVACGEGYGSSLLARVAPSVVGVDVSAAAIAHATGEYANVANARFVEASCTALPFPDASFDLVVSFETIEHIEQHDLFMDEVARVLAPGGILLISSPDKREYSDRRAFNNAFHVKELYREELAALVGARFPAMAWYGQKATFYSLIAPEAPAAGVQLTEVDEEDPSHAADHLSHPMYFIVAAARDAAHLQAVPGVLGVLADRGDWVQRDYEKVMKWLTGCVAEREALEKTLGERDASIEAAAQEHSTREQRQREEVQALEDQLQQERAESIRLRLALSAAEHAVGHARSWRGWLRQPWVWLGILKPRR